MERDADVVPPRSLLVRGGSKRTTDVLTDDIESAVEQGYGPVLSVFADVAAGTESPEQLLYRVSDEADVPQPKIQTSTAEALTDAGFVIEPYVEEGWPESHCHVAFNYPVQESQVQLFIDTFSAPNPNPTGGRKARR